MQTLGIPLNYPQGGGFDFSTFPQFFWSDFRFQPGPSPAGLDPRGVAGTMTLLPWTAKALSDKAPESRYTGLYSNSDLTQISISAKYKDQVAVLAGDSSGLANGPSASISGRLYEDASLSLRYHLLFTDIDAEIEENPPEAIVEHSTTLRTIPVLQADWKITPELLLKSSVYYDNNYLRTDDPSGGSFSQERTDQFGFENALFYQGWKLGANTREIRYNATAAGENPFKENENVSTFQISKLFKAESGDGSAFSSSRLCKGSMSVTRDFIPKERLVCAKNGTKDIPPFTLAETMRADFHPSSIGTSFFLTPIRSLRSSRIPTSRSKKTSRA